MQYKNRSIINRQTEENRSPNMIDSRGYNSPRHYLDYNSYMTQQKKYSKIEKPHYLNSHSINSQSHIIPSNETIMIGQLIKQNDFLINQLMNRQKKEEGYKRTIKRLERCKSQRCTIAPENITILDHSNLNLVESKLTNQSSRIQSRKYGLQISTKIHEAKRCKKLLDESMSYIHQSKQTLSNQIEQLNDKLCRLVQEGSSELNWDQKKLHRLEMSKCVKQLQQLKKNFEQLF